MSEQKTVSASGGDTLGMLGVLFVALKLTGVVHWSWWLVLMPFWFGLAVCAVSLIVFGFIFLIAALVS